MRAVTAVGIAAATALTAIILHNSHQPDPDVGACQVMASGTQVVWGGSVVPDDPQLAYTQAHATEPLASIARQVRADVAAGILAPADIRTLHVACLRVGVTLP